MSTSPIIPTAQTNFGAVKIAIHRKLIQKLILESLVVGESTPMSLQERERLSQEVLDEVFGLGPLEPLLADPTISDILVTTPKLVYIERGGKLYRTRWPFKHMAHLMAIIDRIVSAI